MTTTAQNIKVLALVLAIGLGLLVQGQSADHITDCGDCLPKPTLVKGTGVVDQDPFKGKDA